MPTYSILKDLVYQGHQVPQVGAGFNDYLLQDLLRGQFKFDGVITSDWGITGDCPQVCRDNEAARVVHRLVGRRACRGATRTRRSWSAPR